jgi:hypothetical protein
MRSLTFEPMIAPALWASVAVAAIGLLVWYARRRPEGLSRFRWAGITALMSAGLAGLLLILLNPTWIEVIPPVGGRPRLGVLLDTSASMNTGDVRGKTRWAEAARIAAGLSELPGYTVSLKTFDESVSSRSPQSLASVKPDGTATDLRAAIEAATADMSGGPGGGIVLLSDGINNAGETSRVIAAARVAKGIDAPVYAVPLGGAAEIRDVALELHASQDLAFVGQQTPVVVSVSQTGMPGVRTLITLLQDGKELQRQEVTIDKAATVRFSVVGDRPGLSSYQVRAAVAPGEATELNNRALFLLRTVQEPIRVLLLEGKPYWDAKFLMRTLAADPLVEVQSVVRVAERRLVRQRVASTRPSSAPAAAAGNSQPASAPALAGPAKQQQWAVAAGPGEVLADRAALSKVGVVILGREADVFLTDTAVANLRDWLSRDGGCLLCYRGSPVVQMNERLARMLPVTWTAGPETRFPLGLSDRGRELRWLSDVAGEAASLPLLATSAVGRTKPLATVLAATPSDLPLWTYSHYGLGRVVMIEGAGMWRWSFLPNESAARDPVYSTLWHNLLRWLLSGQTLLPGEKLALRSQKVRFSSSEPAVVLLQAREAEAAGVPAVQLIEDGGAKGTAIVPAPVKDEPSAYRAVFGQLKPGHYRVRTQGAAAVETVFEVVSGLEERLELNARPDLLARIAEESGGALLKDGSPADVHARMSEHLARSNPPRSRRTPAWDRWWILLLMLGVWSGCWALRRSGGLI